MSGAKIAPEKPLVPPEWIPSRDIWISLIILHRDILILQVSYHKLIGQAICQLLHLCRDNEYGARDINTLVPFDKT